MVPLAVAVPRQVLQIRPDSEENLADMRAFLQQAATKPDVASPLATAGIAPGDFVERLVERAKGVWLVLRYVLADIRTGARRPDDLESLPVGLWQYYAQFWRTWQQDHSDRWADADLPYATWRGG